MESHQVMGSNGHLKRSIRLACKLDTETSNKFITDYLSPKHGPSTSLSATESMRGNRPKRIPNFGLFIWPIKSCSIASVKRTV